MAYNDARFDSRVLVPFGYNIDFGTFTGAGTASNNIADVTAQLPEFNRRTRITGFKLRTVTAPNAAATDLVATLLNGTATVAQITLTTASAAEWLSATMTPANAIFAVGDQPTITVIGTSTASGAVLGDFDGWLETQELFSP